jgi:predicted glycosyltransferase
MVTGPLMDPAEHDRLEALARRAGVAVRRVVPALRSHVALADCLVAMGGYNTTCDILSFGLPAVLMPRVGPSQEQALRAQRLAEWGVATVVGHGSDAEGRLAEAIATSLDRGTDARPPVALDGLERAIDVLDSIATEVRA